MVSKRPIKRLLKPEKTKAAVFTPLDLKKLIFIATARRNPERNEFIVRLLFGAGLRVTEAARITIGDALNEDGSWKLDITLPAKICKSGKSGKPGHVSFRNKKLLAAGDKYLAVRVSKKQWLGDAGKYRGLARNSPLVLAEGGRAWSLKNKSYIREDGVEVTYQAAETLQNLFSQWCKEAGIKGASSHSGRRTLATALARKGVPDDVIASVLRHSDGHHGDVFEYIDADFAGIRRTIERLYEK